MVLGPSCGPIVAAKRSIASTCGAPFPASAEPSQSISRPLVKWMTRGGMASKRRSATKRQRPTVGATSLLLAACRSGAGRGSMLRHYRFPWEWQRRAWASIVQKPVRSKETPAEESEAAAWPEAVYRVLKAADVRQAVYVPDAGHT